METVEFFNIVKEDGEFSLNSAVYFKKSFEEFKVLEKEYKEWRNSKNFSKNFMKDNVPKLEIKAPKDARESKYLSESD